MHTIVYEKDPNEVKVAYICDRKQCENCSYPLCSHTTDITHAVNFKNLADGTDFMYMEDDLAIKELEEKYSKLLKDYQDHLMKETERIRNGLRFNEVYTYMRYGHLPPLKED